MARFDAKSAHFKVKKCFLNAFCIEKQNKTTWFMPLSGQFSPVNIALFVSLNL